jgi:hypothetical protein
MTTTTADLAALAEMGKARRAAAILAKERRYQLTSTVFGDQYLPYSQAKQWTAYSPDCIGNHANRIPPAAARHAWLCHDCTEGIKRDLFALAGCWDFLGELLTRGPGKPGERSGSNENAAAPLDLTVADLRLRISGWSAEVLAHVVEDKPGAGMPDELTAPNMLRWLGRWHAYYIATHPQDSFPESVLTEIADLLGQVRALSFPDGTRRRPIASACAALGEDFAPCGGRLTALVRDRLDPRGSVIVCAADPGHLIPESEWLGILKTKTKGRKA